MSALDSGRAAASLKPVRAALIRDAEADAQRAIDAAQAEADRIIANARHTARQTAETARAAGRKAGTRAADADVAGLRRGLRNQLLAARDDAYRSWRQEGAEAVLRLRDDPRYQSWKEALTRTARDMLGADAHVVEHPQGGVVAELGSRRVDLSLPALADRALDQVAEEVDGLWS